MGRSTLKWGNNGNNGEEWEKLDITSQDFDIAYDTEMINGLFWN